MANDSGNQRDRPKTIVATPKPATESSIVRPARRIGGRCAMRIVIRTGPKAAPIPSSRALSVRRLAFRPRRRSAIRDGPAQQDREQVERQGAEHHLLR